MKIKIKICGLTNYEDAKNAAYFGADFLGFIEYKKSPRFIDLELVCDIAKNIKTVKKDIKIVGVFVNETLGNLEIIAKKGIFDVFQLHGDEDFDYINTLKQKLENSKIKIWKALRIKEKNDIERLDKYLKLVDKVLLDTYKDSLYGGTGTNFDWDILETIDKNVLKDQIILSGGIGLENILEALKQDVFAIDVNSKIEKSPGKKNLDMMKKMFDVR
jgi:phosphoribosylanthranilate isomerase